MPRLALIHTVPALVGRFRPLIEAALPGWERLDRVDETLLAETVRHGQLTESTEARLAAHIRDAAAVADAVLVTCSTLGETVDALRAKVSVPLFRIDRGMAVQAVWRGRRIGVLATLPTTLGPTGRLIRDTAATAKRDVIVAEHLCDGAFAELASGNHAAHDEKVRTAFEALVPEVDVVVLAQASMANALFGLASSTIPVLTSPELGIAAIAAELTQTPGGRSPVQRTRHSGETFS